MQEELVTGKGGGIARPERRGGGARGECVL